MKSVILLLIIIIAFCFTVYSVGEDNDAYWKNIGPKWHCAFNPDYSEYCIKEDNGSDNV